MAQRLALAPRGGSHSRERTPEGVHDKLVFLDARQAGTRCLRLGVGGGGAPVGVSRLFLGRKGGRGEGCVCAKTKETEEGETHFEARPHAALPSCLPGGVGTGTPHGRLNWQTEEVPVILISTSFRLFEPKPPWGVVWWVDGRASKHGTLALFLLPSFPTLHNTRTPPSVPFFFFSYHCSVCSFPSPHPHSFLLFSPFLFVATDLLTHLFSHPATHPPSLSVSL